MSSTMLAAPAVTVFAASVRSALADLSAEELDDLTDGLEADLTERLDDADGAELGDPAEYAEELRTAAGLPRRAVRRSGIAAEFAELRKAPGAVAREFREFVARTPALGRLAELLVTLRPVWWVFRAAAVTALAALFIGEAPVNGLSVVFGITALIVSVQFGRGRWLPFAWMRALLLAVNIILVIATPFVVVGWATQLNNATYAQQYAESIPDQSSDGLTLNGNPVSNIFAYDAEGNPLTEVQLFDQDGKPLNTVSDPTMPSGSDGSDDTVLVPDSGVAGRLGWNVFPLSRVATDDLADDGTVKSSATPTPASAPFATAKPIAGSEAATDPSPEPSATPPQAPAASPTP